MEPSTADAPLDGLLLVDKPEGISSHAVVATVRRQLGRGAKVGHAGTLDPFATGLMLVLVGRGTRAAQFLVGLDKRYETLAQLGALSTTGDPEGEITTTGRVPASPLALPTGELRQRPPAYSAIKIDGERAYKRARRGEEVQVPERLVHIHAFEELERVEDQVRLHIHCGSGTYVRSLVADLGDGYCLTLRRLTVGPFAIDQAAPLDAFTGRQAVAERLLPLHQALGFLPTLTLDSDQAQRIRHGKRLSVDEMTREVPDRRPLLLVDEVGAVAVGESDGAQIATVVGFRA